MDHRNAAALVDVRVRIFVRGWTVRGPTRVANPEAALQRPALQKPRQPFVNFSLFLVDAQLMVANDGQAGAVITAIFKPTEAFEQDRRGGAFTDVAYDAAHTGKSEI